MKTFVFTPPDALHAARVSTCCTKSAEGRQPEDMLF